MNHKKDINAPCRMPKLAVRRLVTVFSTAVKILQAKPTEGNETRQVVSQAGIFL